MPPKKKSPKPCKKTQERNPETNRCVLKCKKGYERKPDNFSKCIKSCIAPQTRSPTTGRCKKPTKSPKRKKIPKTPTRRNPVRLVRKKRSPSAFRECSVCLEPTKSRTFCTSGKRHNLCTDCYYRLLESGIHYCTICREFMDKPPGK